MFRGVNVAVILYCSGFHIFHLFHAMNCICWQGRTQEGVGVKKKPLSLIFYKIFITCAKEIKCFRILFACQFVDLMEIPRNKFACKFQGAL